MPLEHVSNRSTPPTFPVKPHLGRVQSRYGNVEYIAPGGELRWEPWSNAEYVREAFRALALIEQRAVGNEACNRFFAESMPGKKTLREIWNAKGPARVRVSYSKGPSAMWRAATYGQAPYEWTITETTVRLGAESIAAAMLHEATRTNGVTREEHIAYGAGRICGMRPYVLTARTLRQLGWPTRSTK